MRTVIGSVMTLVTGLQKQIADAAAAQAPAVDLTALSAAIDAGAAQLSAAVAANTPAAATPSTPPAATAASTTATVAPSTTAASS